MTTAAQALEALSNLQWCGYDSHIGGPDVDGYVATLRQHIESTAAEMEALRKDAARLDYLDARNAAKNAKNGTTYGWRLTENHNRIALEDHHWPAIDVRAAIDAAELGRRG